MGAVVAAVVAPVVTSLVGGVWKLEAAADVLAIVFRVVEIEVGETVRFDVLELLLLCVLFWCNVVSVGEAAAKAEDFSDVDGAVSAMSRGDEQGWQRIRSWSLSIPTCVNAVQVGSPVYCCSVNQGNRLFFVLGLQGILTLPPL